MRYIRRRLGNYTAQRLYKSLWAVWLTSKHLPHNHFRQKKFLPMKRSLGCFNSQRLHDFFRVAGLLSPHDEPSLHLALALDGLHAPADALELTLNQSLGVGAHLNLAGLTM